MKKLLNKFRLWLIDKLGGTYPVAKVVRHAEKAVVLQTKTYIPDIMVFASDFDKQQFVKRELIIQLAQEIMNNDNLVEIEQQRDYETESIVIRAKIAVYGGVKE